MSLDLFGTASNSVYLGLLDRYGANDEVLDTPILTEGGTLADYGFLSTLREGRGKSTRSPGRDLMNRSQVEFLSNLRGATVSILESQELQGLISGIVAQLTGAVVLGLTRGNVAVSEYASVAANVLTGTALTKVKDLLASYDVQLVSDDSRNKFYLNKGHTAPSFQEFLEITGLPPDRALDLLIMNHEKAFFRDLNSMLRSKSFKNRDLSSIPLGAKGSVGDHYASSTMKPLGMDEAHLWLDTLYSEVYFRVRSEN